MTKIGNVSNNDAMTAAELAALASQCYGQFWQSPLAREMTVNVRTVQRWAADGIQKASTAENVRRFLTDRRVVSVPAPTAGLPEDERDDACHDALAQPLTALAMAADNQGWHPAEVWTAILAITAEQLYLMAGKTAAAETMQQAIDTMRDWPERQD